MFVVMLYYFVIGRNFLQPYVLNPIYEFFGIYPLSSWLRILNAFFRDLGLPTLVYILYTIFAKKKCCLMFSMSRLSLKNVLYISVITLTIRVIFSLIENGIPFFFNGGVVSMQTFYFMDIGQSLLHNAILATLFEEFVFRGFLWGEYRQQHVSYWKIALATGLFFGIIHLGTFNMFHTTISGIFFYAPLIYFTRSIWSPILHHAIMNGTYTLISPTFYINNQADFNEFMPIYLIILISVAIILSPLAIICGKRFYQENKHNAQTREKLPPESKMFRLTYWSLILIMMATFLRAF